jgi:hypothetical protein
VSFILFDLNKHIDNVISPPPLILYAFEFNIFLYPQKWDWEKQKRKAFKISFESFLFYVFVAFENFSVCARLFFFFFLQMTTLNAKDHPHALSSVVHAQVIHSESRSESGKEA